MTYSMLNIIILWLISFYHKVLILLFIFFRYCMQCPKYSMSDIHC
jgi:hypothetical protein